jgi:hypothetical protein
MTWDEAMAYARKLSRTYGRRTRVIGYRNNAGHWVYRSVFVPEAGRNGA